MGMMMRVVEHTIGPKPLTPNATALPQQVDMLQWTSPTPRDPVRRPPPGRMAPGMNGSVFGGSSHNWPVRGLGADSIHSQSARGTLFPNGGVGLVLGLALGAAAGGLLLVMAVVAVFIKKWYGTRHKATLDFDMDDRTTIASSRSAPNTRSNTPDSMRRSKTNLMRSITMDMISIETDLTSLEAVQPESSTDDGTSSYTGSTQTLLGQHHFVGQQPVYNDAFELEECGNGRASPLRAPSLAYSIVYDRSSEKLIVNVIKATNLTGRESNTKLRDPFVKVCVLPDEKAKQQGRVHRGTLEPNFNDSFAFYISRKEINKRTVRISVYDIDKRRVRHTLGHVLLDLRDVDLTSGDVRWAQLHRRAYRTDQERADLGHLQLTLTFLPASEEIHLVVGALQGLHKFKLGKREGLCARCSLLVSGRPSSSHTTPVIYDINHQGHMTFAEPMSFAIPTRQLEACSFSIELVIIHQDAGPDQPGVEFGQVTVGSHLYARKEGLSHWTNMIGSSRTPITEWHRVAPPTITPNSSPD